MIIKWHATVIWALCLVVLALGPWQGSAAASGDTTTPDYEWIWVANNPGGNIHAYNVKTGQSVGFLGQGSMGSLGGGLFDVAVTPDGKTAMVTNFGDSLVCFWDVTNPVAPVHLSNVNIGYFAEDMAVTHDGKYVLVTDGGFSDAITVIDISSRQIVYQNTQLPSAYLNAVAVAPNGTVLGADYFGGKIHVLTIDDNGWITFVKTIFERPFNDLSVLSRAVNIEISPDGQTALSAIAGYDFMEVFRISGKGEVTHTGFIMGLCKNTQSIVFDDDGQYAYGLHNYVNQVNSSNEFRISKIRIDGPGQATLMNPRAYWAHAGGSSQLFGVDCMAYVNGKIYIGNPTISSGNNFVQCVDLSTGDVSKVIGPWGRNAEFIPSGLCAIPTTTPPIEPSLELSSPAQGARWKIGSNQTIEWTQQGLTGNAVISLYKKGVLLGIIATVPITDLQYVWKAGQYRNDHKTAKYGRYTVTIRTEDGAHSDTSPGFKLTN